MGICVGLVTCDPTIPSLVLDGEPFFPRGVLSWVLKYYYIVSHFLEKKDLTNSTRYVDGGKVTRMASWCMKLVMFKI